MYPCVEVSLLAHRLFVLGFGFLTLFSQAAGFFGASLFFVSFIFITVYVVINVLSSLIIDSFSTNRLRAAAAVMVKKGAQADGAEEARFRSFRMFVINARISESHDKGILDLSSDSLTDGNNPTELYFPVLTLGTSLGQMN